MLETESRQEDNYSAYITENIDLLRIRVGQIINIELKNNYELELLREKGYKFGDFIKKSFLIALREFWYLRIAKLKQTDSILIKQQIIKDKVSGRMNWLKHFNDLKITFSISKDILKPINLSDATQKMEGELIYFDCLIAGIEPRMFLPIKALLECNCGVAEFYLPIEKNKTCPDCENRYKINRLSKIYKQKLILQEPDDQAKNYSPEYIPANLYGNNVDGSTALGQRKRVLGIYRGIPKNKNEVEERAVIDIILLENLDEPKDHCLTLEELNILKKQHDENPSEFLSSIIRDFAPHIYGRELEKMAIILSLIDGTDLKEYRKQIHVLLDGDQSSGKSELLKAACGISSKCDYIDGSNASAKGIIFGLDDYDGSKILKAGPVIKNNGGHVCIDEFDKMDKHDRKALNVCMEQQFAKYDKTGHNVMTPTKTGVIAAANPSGSNWLDEQRIIDNLKPLEPVTISRFDIIIRLKTSSRMLKEQTKWINERSRITYEPIMTNRLLKGLIGYLKYQNPDLTEEADKELQDYVDRLVDIQQEDGALMITQRQIIGLKRISGAMAKLHFKQKIDVETIKQTISFYNETLETLGMKTDKGAHQFNLQGVHAKKDDLFWHIVKTISDENGKFIESNLLPEMLKSPHWKTIESARGYFNMLLTGNEKKLYEPEPGKYKRI